MQPSPQLLQTSRVPEDKLGCTSRAPLARYKQRMQKGERLRNLFADLAWFGHERLWKPFKGLTGAFGFHTENLGDLLLNELILLALKSRKPEHLPSLCDSLFPRVMAFSGSNLTSNWCPDKCFTFPLALVFLWRDTWFSQLNHRRCTVFSTWIPLFVCIIE